MSNDLYEDSKQYVVTLTKEIYLGETGMWNGGRTDVIQCSEYELDEREVTLFYTGSGHEKIIVSRDVVAAIADNRDWHTAD